MADKKVIRTLHRQAEWCCLGRRPIADLKGIVNKLKKLGEDVSAYQPIESSATARSRRLVPSGLPKRFAKKDYSKLTPLKGQETLVKIAKQYLLDFDDNYQDEINLAMIGTCGTGKTHTACWLFTHLAHQALDYAPRVFSNFGVFDGGVPFLRKRYPMYTTLSDMWRTLQAAQFDKLPGKTRQSVLDGYINAGYLIIDEFGMVDDNKLVVSAIQDVLSGRYNMQLPTCIISNQTKEDLHEFMGDRPYSRFFSNCDVAILDGEDLRAEGY